MKNIIRAFLLINLIINGNLAIKEIKKGDEDSLTDSDTNTMIDKGFDGYDDLLAKFNK